MTETILRLQDVIKKTGLSRSSIYAMANKNAFPKPIPLGTRAVGWVEAEVCTWLAERMNARKV